MLDSSVSVTGSVAKSFPPIPADVYQCEITDVEMRDGKAYQSDEIVPQLNFTFRVIEEGKHYGRKLWRSMAPKLSGGTKQSTLYQFLAVITGKPYTKEECAKASEIVTADFLNSIVGEQIRLSVVTKAGEDGVERNKIAAFMPVKEKLSAFDESKVKKEE